MGHGLTGSWKKLGGRGENSCILLNVTRQECVYTLSSNRHLECNRYVNGTYGVKISCHHLDKAVRWQGSREVQTEYNRSCSIDHQGKLREFPGNSSSDVDGANLRGILCLCVLGTRS